MEESLGMQSVVEHLAKIHSPCPTHTKKKMIEEGKKQRHEMDQRV